MMEKKAQGLSINAIILIILGVAVLVILVLGFTTGWDQFAFWIPSNNVKTVVQACDMACSSQSVYDYCSITRDLKTQEGTFKNVTCYILAYGDEFVSYGAKKCSALNCKEVTPCRDSGTLKAWSYINPQGVLTPVVITDLDKKVVTDSYCKIL